MYVRLDRYSKFWINVVLGGVVGRSVLEPDNPLKTKSVRIPELTRSVQCPETKLMLL